MKKLLALALAVIMAMSIFAGCQPADTQDGATLDYVYNTYTTALGTNWNPHTWENSGDSTILAYLETPLTDLTVKDSVTGEYQWIFVAAESITDVTKDHQDDLVKYGASETDATEGYVYEIKLRPEMKWENGTAINADTYIYSMKALLDPTMRNYRAGNYYSGESALAGANAYFNSGSPIYTPMVPAYGEDDTPDYSYDLEKGIADGHVYLCLTSTDMTLYPGLSMADFIAEYTPNGEPYYDELAEQENIYGRVPVTAENLDTVKSLLAEVLTAFSMKWADLDAETQDGLLKEILYTNAGEVGEMLDYDSTVGLYKVDEYTIRYVCQDYYDYYYFLTSCTSNWLVYEELYEAGKDTTGELVTTNYATSKDTTMSYGVYKIESLQEAKQITFVQNENYFEFTKNEDGTLSSTTETIGFKVDGAYQPQYLTQKIVIDQMTDDAAKLAFLSGQLDDWTPSPDEVVEYSTSEQLYQVDETYTQRLFFCTDLEKLQAMDKTGNTNSVVMSNEAFRKAFSLSLDRKNFVEATAGYKPAAYLINSLYFYDVYNDPASIYRNTEEAMQAVCNIYGVEYGAGKAYATLEEAYKSVTGYNLTEAKALMKQACDELVAAGLYTAGEPIVIQVAWAKGDMNSADNQQVALLNQYINAAAEGSGFGKIELKAVANLNERYKDVSVGTYAIGWGAWGGAAFYPFTMFRVYCDAEYAGYLHEASCWDPATEKLTLTINGEEVTMTWYEWSNSMTGTGKYSTADNKTKLAVLAAIEENFIEKYYCIPVCTTTVCSMLSYKTSNYTENYSIMYGFGGMRLMKYNYTVAEWNEFVAAQGGTLTY